MTSYTMRLLKCPACGGPIDPPTGESSTKCPYCGNAVVIPESLRKADPQQQQTPGTLFSGMDLGAMMGYGAQWSEVVMLAQRGQKDEAVKKYMGFSNVSESEARRVVDSLAGAQTYEFTPGSGSASIQVAPLLSAYADSARSMTRWSMWLGCGITAFVLFIIAITTIPAVFGIVAGLWAAFKSF